MQPLRVSLVTPRFSPQIGGVETHVEQLARHLARAGHQVQVLTQAPPADFRALGPATMHPDGYLVRRWAAPVPSVWDVPPPGLLNAAAHLGGAAHVVHAHSYHQLPALAAACSMDVPLVLNPHYHGTGRTKLRAALHRPYKALGRWMVGRAAAVIADSRAEEGLLLSNFGPRLAERLHVVPSGIDPPPLAEPFRLPGRTVLSVGRLERYKRIDLVLSALACLPGDVRLAVAGDGSTASELQLLAERLGVAERVRFLGAVGDEDLARWWASADVFVTASEQEAFGITCATAAACGVRAVASALPAHRELLRGPGTRLVEDASGSAYAQALSAVLNECPPNPAPLPTWKQVTDKIVEIYVSVMGAYREVAR